MLRQIEDASVWHILFWRSLVVVPVLFAFTVWTSGGRPFTSIRRIGLAGGLVDNKVCAIDETWSGLRLVVRVENRAAVAYRAEPPLSVRRRRATATVPATGSSGRRAEARRR